MSFLFAILLGVLQGLTEFIPVSSSGHLVLAQHFLGVGESSDILFELFMHLGTLAAVLIYFRGMLWDMFVSMFSWRNTMNQETHRMNRNLIVYLAIASVMTALFYMLFDSTLQGVYSQPMLVAVLLLFTGAFVMVSDYLKDSGIPASNMGFLRAVIIGLAQGIAILPGISRSGATITASLATGIKRREAASFSFLLSIPAILGANLSQIKSFTKLDITHLHSYLAGFFFSFAVGYLVIAFLINLIEQGKLKYFAVYCWIVGALSIIMLTLGR